MPQRSFGFVAMLAVMAVSVVFGMMLGGKLNAPPIVHAAGSSTPMQLATPIGGSGVTSFADIVERSLPAVVGVTTTTRTDGESDPQSEELRRFFFGQPDGPSPERSVGAGTGFIISEDGYIITNNHVIENYDKIDVTMSSGEVRKAELVGADRSIDLALLKIDTEGQKLPTLALGDSESLRVGEWVIAIGNPHDFDHTVTVGVVSGKERRVPLPQTDFGVVSFIQTDAAINLGNSGGPLIDSRGNVIGINTAIRRQNYAEGIGFALPINTARNVMEQLRDRGEVRRGWIGITMNDAGIDDTVRDYYGLPDSNGVLVREVTSPGPAERAGVKVGDVIRSVGGHKIKDIPDMIGQIASRQPGDRVDVTVFRSGKMHDLKIKLGDRAEGLTAQLGRAAPERVIPIPEPQESEGLGLTVETLSGGKRSDFGLDDDQRGALVTEVDFQSEADTKGLRPNMIIVAVNDTPVGGVDEWESAVGGLRGGEAVKLDVVFPGRDGRHYFFLRAPEASP